MAMRTLPPCPVETTLFLIGSKWKVLILRDLMDGAKRFNELLRSLNGVSQKVLTEALRSMEEDGLVVREIFPTVPVKVEYTLTELGQSLRPIIESLKEWGLAYQSLNSGQ